MLFLNSSDILQDTSYKSMMLFILESLNPPSYNHVQVLARSHFDVTAPCVSNEVTPWNWKSCFSCAVALLPRFNVTAPVPVVKVDPVPPTSFCGAVEWAKGHEFGSTRATMEIYIQKLECPDC